MTKKHQPTGMNTLNKDTKQPTWIPQPQQVKIPDEIGKYMACDTEEVTRLGWTVFVHWRRGRGDFASLLTVEHPARGLLQQYKHYGVPVMLMTGEWTEGERLGVPGIGTPQVLYGTPPFSLQGIHLDGGEGSVDSVPVLGCQKATRTQVNPARSKSGKGWETTLARQLYLL